MTIAAGPGAIPASVGIGLRPRHHGWVNQRHLKADWLEVHVESFMTQERLRSELELIARQYPLSLHVVGLSLGSVSPPEPHSLQQLRELITRFEPDLVSDHLSGSAVQGTPLPDLLPLPYTEESLRVVIRNVHRVQDVLGRQLLLENPSRRLDSPCSTLHEAEFLAEVTLRTGCGVLLDINNLCVSAVNQGADPASELDELLSILPEDSFREIHLSPDEHGSHVSQEVWSLYQSAVAMVGFVPTLIEWDQQIPDFEVLQQEARTARSLMYASAPQGGLRTDNLSPYTTAVTLP